MRVSARPPFAINPWNSTPGNSATPTRARRCSISDIAFANAQGTGTALVSDVSMDGPETADTSPHPAIRTHIAKHVTQPRLRRWWCCRSCFTRPFPNNPHFTMRFLQYSSPQRAAACESSLGRPRYKRPDHPAHQVESTTMRLQMSILGCASKALTDCHRETFDAIVPAFLTVAMPSK